MGVVDFLVRRVGDAALLDLISAHLQVAVPQLVGSGQLFQSSLVYLGFINVSSLAT